MNPVDPNTNSNSSNEVGGMFSNTGDSSRPDPSTDGGVGGTFFNTSDAPTRAPINPNNNPGSGMFSNDSDAPQSETSAGYENNVEREGGEGKKKHGLLSKVKEAFVPKPGAIGRTGNEDLTSDDAAGFHPERDGGRHEQANRDLNRE